MRVTNYGRRIPADQLQVVFDPLVQIPQEQSDDDVTSLGLGLYIAHEIVAMHGGTMVAESSEEDGTVFSAHLPRFQPTRPESSQ